eukprot:SAG11_NODE_1602_length_4600_cov_1.859587_2_plen_311_part_00
MGFLPRQLSLTRWQVASEFIVTGNFLLVTAASWLLESSGAPAHQNILPAPPIDISPGCDACACDLDGTVAGVSTGGAGGGCAPDRNVADATFGDMRASDLISPVPLCPVPNDCADAAVQNTTAAMKAVYGDGWEQPGGFAWRVCSTNETATDKCDPTGDPTRDNALAFATVFFAQCCAIALGHVVQVFKLRRMVAAHNRDRRRALADPRVEQWARRFVAEAEKQASSAVAQDEKLSLKARFRRAGIVAKFGARLTKAVREQESVDDVVLEISEAVAAHWRASLSYFVAGGTSAMTVTFLFAAMVVSSQGS